MQLATVGGKATASIPNGIETFIAGMGLARVNPSSVTVGSGSFLTSPLGMVTFTTAGTNISLNGAFNDAVAHKYKIIIEVSAASATPTIALHLRNATPTDIITNYDQVVSIAAVSTGSVVTTAAGTMVNFSTGSGAATHYIEVEISNPAATVATTGTFRTTSTSLAGAITGNTGWFDQRDVISYTGFSIIPSTGTITGRVWVCAMLDVG